MKLIDIVNFLVGMCTYLGKSEEPLSDVDNILHLLNRLDAILNGLGVLSPRAVENILDALNMTISPVTVWLPNTLPSQR